LVFATLNGSSQAEYISFHDDDEDAMHNVSVSDAVPYLKEDLSRYSVKFLPPHANTAELIHTNPDNGDFIYCLVNYSSQFADNYALVAYSGRRTFGGGMFNLGIQACGVLFCKCTTDFVLCCNQTPLDLVANVAVDKDDFRMDLIGQFKSHVKPFPVHLSHEDMKPIKNAHFSLSNEAQNEYLLSLKNGEVPFSFGLYARDYSLDQQ